MRRSLEAADISELADQLDGWQEALSAAESDDDSAVGASLLSWAGQRLGGFSGILEALGPAIVCAFALPAETTCLAPIDPETGCLDREWVTREMPWDFALEVLAEAQGRGLLRKLAENLGNVWRLIPTPTPMEKAEESGDESTS